jgi:peroxiredoxin
MTQPHENPTTSKQDNPPLYLSGSWGNGRRMALFSRLLLFFIVSACAVSAATASPDDIWRDVVALDSGPRETPKNAVEGRKIALGHFEKQESSLRAFLKQFPADARRVEARLRLARVLQMRADVQDQKIPSPEVETLIREAEKMAKPEQRADVEFARLSYTMRSMREPTPQQRQRMYDAARAFQTKHPTDRRLAGLLAEISTLFDLQPKTKQSLLIAAQAHAADADLKSRIADDLRRIDLLGQEISLRFQSPDGTLVDVADYRGKAVLVMFFASWSPPAVEAVIKLQKSLPELPSEQVQIMGVSLDRNREPLERLVAELKIEWPIICDGKGWESTLVRSIGINSLPTAWLLDREGKLRSLNAMIDMSAQVREIGAAKK